MVIEALLLYGIPGLFRNISLELVHDSRQCGRGRRLPGIPYFDDKMNVIRHDNIMINAGIFIMHWYALHCALHGSPAGR